MNADYTDFSPSVSIHSSFQCVPLFSIILLLFFEISLDFLQKSIIIQKKNTGEKLMNQNKRLYKMVLTALFTAMVTVATMIIQIPSPMQGYVNLGDCIILLAAWLLGPAAGLFAGGVGSMLTDLLSGYAHYAPGTLVIKGLMAVAAALLFTALKAKKEDRKSSIIAKLVSGVAAEAIMVAGYFGYACLLLGKGLAAATSIPGNLFQGLVGIAAAMLLHPLLKKAGI